MKKCFYVFIVAMGMLTAARAQQKTVTGLTKDELVVLQEKNPDFRIDLGKWDPQLSPYFSGLEQAQDYVDSLREAALKMTRTEQQGVLVQGSKEGKYAPCDCGGFSANVGGAGLFSSFNLSFSYCNGNMSNANMYVTGWQLGWSWNAGPAFISGLNGCIAGTATFSLGIFSWNQVVHVRWSFNPGTCMLFYSLDNGGCGAFSI